MVTEIEEGEHLIEEQRRLDVQPLPAPDLFVREDVSKPENRVNLALFNLMLLAPFRRWFLQQLGLNKESTVYPPQNVPGGRPDFVVVGPDGRVAAWVEVELRGENAGQLAAYSQALAEPVKSIVGREPTGGDSLPDLSLEKIATRIDALDVNLDFDRQQAMNAGVLTRLIAELAGLPGPGPKVPGGAVREAPLIKALHQRMGNTLTFGIPPVTPGTVQVATMSVHGWAIRVFSMVSTTGYVGLMNKPTGHKFVRIPALGHLKKYLPHAQRAVGSYADLISDLGVDIARFGPSKHVPVGEEELLAQVDRLAECLSSLARAYGGLVSAGSTT